MGIMRNGPHGSVYGKVGKLVTYRVLNRDVVRLVGQNKKAASLGQLTCRQQMSVVVQFLKPMLGFINVGFMLEGVNADLYAHNMAVSYNKLQALTGQYPSILMDYSKVLVAKGSLPLASNAAVALVPEGLRFTWATGPWMDFTERRYTAMLLAYFPDLGIAVYETSGAKRFNGTDVLFLNDDLRNACMQVYLSFLEVGSNDVANSVYLGSING